MHEVKFVRKLLELATESISEQTDGVGFKKLGEKIGTRKGKEITQKYLRENLWYQILRAEKAQIKNKRFSTPHLDAIARFLKYEDFSAFVLATTRPGEDELKKFIGTWCSYVCANTGEQVFVAPVRFLADENGKVKMELIGEHHHFSGYPLQQGSCLFCTLHSEGDKILNLIFKSGNSPAPKLLQGVFTGISSAGDPIAGRELLVKENLRDWKDMKWHKEKLQASDKLDPRIIKYFSNPLHNCLKINKAALFDWEDLED